MLPSLATIVLRGATSNRLDNLKCAIDDGVNVLKPFSNTGETELVLGKSVEAYGNGLRGLARHAIKLFAAALEVIPRMLAENVLRGAEGNEVVSRLWAKHEENGWGRVGC